LTPAVLGVATFRRDGAVMDAIRPLSPVTTNARPLMDAAAWLRAVGTSTVLVDIDRGFRDLPVVFYGGRREEQVARVREAPDLVRLVREPPEYVVRFEEGRLDALGVRPSGRILRLAGAVFVEMPGFSAPVHVYRRGSGPALRP
jgi:hypothetical protein